MTEHNTTLKPCPFCGNSETTVFLNSKIVYGDEPKSFTEAQIKCLYCSASVSAIAIGHLFGTEKLAKSRAVERWNTRMETANDQS